LRTATKKTEVGHELSPLSVMFTLEMCRAYSGWPENKNFHTDIDIAKKKGFLSVLVEASVSGAYINEILTRFFGAGWFKTGKLRLTFLRSVHPPQRLTAKGIVREKIEEDSGIRLVVEAWVENENEEKVTVATASALV
jgi:acyl dehydratase